MMLRFLLSLISILPLLSIADTPYEERVAAALMQLEEQDVSASLSELEALIEDYPNSKLGHLLWADLLAARAGSPDLIKDFSENLRQLDGLRDELNYRWLSITNQTPAEQGMVPKNLLTSAPIEQYILAADASLSRVYVFENIGVSYELVADYYMTIGKAGMGKDREGDLRTPEGVYHVTSYLPGEELPPRYGPGAFPINYPNAYDKKLARTGYGIWIHGTEPENYNRVPLASDGCLSLSNDEFVEIQRYISTDGTTPVIISRRFEWVDPSERFKFREEAHRVIELWEKDWESLDTNQYLSHYSRELFNNFDAFASRKHQVNASKSYISIELNNLSVYDYPGDERMMMVTFDQQYQSDNHHSVTRKRQYWKQQKSGRWQIIHEG